jgi:hypothetical protein
MTRRTIGSVKVDAVFEERYWYPDDGAIVWLSGYGLVDEDGRYLARDAPQLADRGLVVTAVAGAARHHADTLAADDAAPGSPLTLRRERANEHDGNAIAVHVAGGRQLGWVPREIASQVATELDAGTAWSALALRESRPSPRDPRTGVTMLLARAARIELVERTRAARRH